jgi:hypothetical protein
VSCINITPLVLSDTFNTWFQRTNEMISSLNSFKIRGLSADSSYGGIKITDAGSCYFEIELASGPFVGFVTSGDTGIYGTGDATNPYNLTLKFNGNEPTLADADLTGNDYFIVSDTSDSSLVKKVSASAVLGLIPEENRYFYGDEAPTASDLMLGDKWFNTTVGSEFTYLPTDEDEDTFFWVDIDHLGQGETGFVRISGDVMTGALTTPFVTMTQGFTSFSGFIGTLTGTNSSFTSLTASNGFIGTLTGTSSSFTSLTASNGFIGTLTGTNSSFTSLTASNGFIGTLTGNNIRYTNAEFGTDSLIIQGSSATFTDMSVMITGNYSFDVGVLSLGQTSNQGIDNLNVPIIKSQGGVLIGGNTDSKQNWLGNNAYLSPEGYSFVGIPNDVPTSWFTADGGTYPFNLYSLTVTGGIHTDRAFRWGHKKGQNTFLDQEFVTKAYVTPDGLTGGQTGAGFVIIPCSRPNTGIDSYIQMSFIPVTHTTNVWTNTGDSGNICSMSNEGTIRIPNDGSFPNINSVVGTVYNSDTRFALTTKITDISSSEGVFKFRIQACRTSPDVPTINSVFVRFVVISN